MSEVECVIVGAGLSGLLQAIKLNNVVKDLVILERGPSVGGTWYWNRYPGKCALLLSEAFATT